MNRVKSTLFPWFSPKITPSLTAVLQGIGHSAHFSRGDVIYRSPELFGRLFFVRHGVVAKGLLEPSHSYPILVTMAGTGSLCGAYENLYVNDRMPRLHWCVTSTELLVVNPDLLLRLCDQHVDWQVELSNYSSLCARCDQIGLIANHLGSPEERLGAFWILHCLQFDKEILGKLATPGIEWVVAPSFPSRSVAASVTGCSVDEIARVVRGWRNQHALRYRARKVFLKREVFAEYWGWIEPVLQSS